MSGISEIDKAWEALLTGMYSGLSIAYAGDVVADTIRYHRPIIEAAIVKALKDANYPPKYYSPDSFYNKESY